MPMQITLTDEDARTLGEYLRDHFKELQREIARTDVKAFRHALVRRLDAIERLLDQLEQAHV